MEACVFVLFSLAWNNCSLVSFIGGFSQAVQSSYRGPAHGSSSGGGGGFDGGAAVQMLGSTFAALTTKASEAATLAATEAQ